MKQQAYSLHASMSSAAGDLSLLVRQYGDCTALTMGALTEAETRALVRKVFFGEGQWEDVQADASGCITSLTVEAEHSLFRHLSENQAFKELFGTIMAQPPISAHTVAAYVRRTLSESDPAQTFIDAFAEVTVRLLYDLSDGSLIVELPAVPDERVASVSTELMVRTPQERPSTRRRLADRRSTVAVDVPQLPLDRLLTEYCDFRQSRAPSLSERDREYLRLLFFCGKDMRSISGVVGVTYQRVQQVVTRATRKLQNDLLAQESYQPFWARLHRFCIATPSVLSSAVTVTLGGQKQSIDVTAVSRFLLYALKSDQALEQYKIGCIRVQCCRGTKQQLDSIAAYLRDVRSRRLGPVSDSDVSAASMYVLSHSELPGISVRGVAAMLLASMSPPNVAEQLERLLIKRKAPSHFADLARCLDGANRGEEVSAEYVHAVLGRDHRFAWAGLGTYALTAWGYPRETNTLDVVLHMIRTKGSGVTLGEVFDFMFTDRHYELRQSSVRQAMKMAEGRQLRRVGADVWDELEDARDNSEVTEHE